MGTANFLLPVLLAFLAFSAAVSNAQENATCTRHLELTPVHNFSLTSILGVWINWNTYSSRAEDVDSTPIHCLRATISNLWENEPFDMNIVERYQNADRQIRQNHTYLWYPDHNIVPSPAIWRRFTLDQDANMSASDSVYVQTDYTSWALQYVCAVKDNRTVESMILWTRTRQPDPQLLDFLEILIQNYGFSLSNRRNIDQSDCDESV